MQGFPAAALHGDIAQVQRERIVSKLKKGELDVVIATDVGLPRGLDVERISHVINYDIPYDNESYIHRIGRTGRAGRNGAMPFCSLHRAKQRLLKQLERTTRQPLETLQMPERQGDQCAARRTSAEEDSGRRRIGRPEPVPARSSIPCSRIPSLTL